MAAFRRLKREDDIFSGYARAKQFVGKWQIGAILLDPDFRVSNPREDHRVVYAASLMPTETNQQESVLSIVSPAEVFPRTPGLGIFFKCSATRFKIDLTSSA